MISPGRTGIPACHFYFNQRTTANLYPIQNRRSCLSLLLFQKTDRQECLSYSKQAFLPVTSTVPKDRQTRMSVLLVINNPGKAFSFEACASHQRTVNVGLRHQTGNVFGLHRTTVNYSQAACGLIRVPIRENAPDKRVHFLRLLRRRRTSGTDGPNRLVGNDDTVEV